MRDAIQRCLENWRDEIDSAAAYRAMAASEPDARLARVYAPDLVLATIAAREEADQNFYVTQPETAGTRMPVQERWHAKLLKQLVQPHGWARHAG
jgi:hypothetical protein